MDLDAIDWAKMDGLVPAIVQDADSLRVLMLGYMNRESLAATLVNKKVTFYSRSRQELWEKGATSGHVLNFVSAQIDCDQDALLIMARPQGPTCHTGSQSCFGDGERADLSLLTDLERIIHARRAEKDSASYTAKLFAAGHARMAQKVGEEGVEVALAGALGAPNLTEEAADLVYHLLVLLASRDLSLADVLGVLASRRK